MRIGRKNKRVWCGIVGLFVATFLFGFLTAKFKNNDTADAANLGNFDAGYIISDYQMSNYNSMSESEIQSFLKSKGNCNDTRMYLADYYTSYSYHIKDGHFVCLADETFGDGTAYGNDAPFGESAAHIIWQAARDYQINPQVLIVLIQKEQGLITDSWPNNRQYRSATGYGCPDTAPCNSDYYGFKNQVRKAAALFRTVLNGGWTNYPLGWNYIQYNPDSDCGGSWVNVRSLATSALYRYTPYQPNSSALAAGYDSGDSCGAYGNRNFYSYFEDWFGNPTATLKSVRVPDGLYYIRNVSAKEMVLEVAGGDERNGANAQIYKLNGTGAQQWRVAYNGTTDDYNIINEKTGKALDVDGGSVSNGANIQIWDKNGSCAQRWKIAEVGGDDVKIVSACSFKAIDISGGTLKNGTNVGLWVDNGTAAQKWELMPVEEAEEGLYTVKSALTDMRAIDISGGAVYASNGTNVQLWNNNYTGAQRWDVKEVGDGYYMVTNLQSGKAIDVLAGRTENGANVQVWNRNNSCAQKWKILKNSDGTYTFISACSNKVVDVAGGKTSNGVNIQIYDANNTKAQKWDLKKADIVESSEYKIASALPGNKVLDITGNWSGNGANIQVYDFNGTNAQRWKITYDDKTDYYTITNPATGKSLDVAGAGWLDGANVQTWGYNGTCAQKWGILRISNDRYIITSACSNMVLDVLNAGTRNGTNVQMWQRNGLSAQEWILDEL